MGDVDVLVVGQVARDLVLLVDDVPGPSGTVPVRQRLEMLGGKGANQAVGLAQLGVRAGLVGVVGDDPIGREVRDQAARDGIDVTGVACRTGARTGLITSVVSGGRWRYLEDLPAEVLLGPSDIERVADLVRAAPTVVLQMQQPGEAMLMAARLAKAAGRRIVLDGAPQDARHRDELLACADIVRADAREARALTGGDIEDAASARREARRLLAQGPTLVALAVRDAGNLVAWPEGETFVPVTGVDVLDTTGAGDAFVAAMTAALIGGRDPRAAARHATAAASATVVRLGGRPCLDEEAMAHHLALVPPGEPATGTSPAAG
ncbi:PfkB family carbohydrate kinase [Rugosimonospora africana]|uniref:Ribokinase n=1 Tax=Rugosimonospora africana TaxID=556532 RepID=A0A8J3VTM8_9ACTN|nr:PfkB family carbohydrate kinase [Rugosimonospora africana]GIH17846.1 ribokinase [Rugosimonospora africana]